MKTKHFSAITLAAAMATVGVFFLNSQAAANNEPQRPMRGRLLERAKDKLGLTDQQTAQIKAILKSEKDNITSLLNRLHDSRAGLHEAINADAANEASVRVASAKIAAVEADLAVERLKLHDKISPILTAEQREKLSELRSRIDELVDKAINRIGQRLAE